MWKEQAKHMFPELLSEVEQAETPYLLWFGLRRAFNNAYSSRRNESLIARIYEFAHWCEEQPRGATAEADLATCVSVSFFEHIAESPAARDDMPRWFSKEEFSKMESV